MKTITVAEIEKVLDEQYEAYKKGEFKTKNVMFMGESFIGKSAITQKWFEKYDDINPYHAEIPTTFWEDYNGYLRRKHDENGNEVMVFSDNFYDKINRENSVIFFDKFNVSLTAEKMELYKPIIKDRIFNSYYNGQKKIENTWLFIAECYPENGVNRTTEIPSDILESFEVYYVEPSVKEFMDYFIADKNELIKKLREDNEEEYALECEFQIKLAKHIFSNDEFKFMFEKDNYFTPGSVSMMISFSSNLEEFLEAMENSYDKDSKIYAMMSNILKDFKE